MITEIVGPAGAGKSTIAMALLQHNPAILGKPHLRWIKYYPAFYSKVVQSLPIYLRQYRGRGQVLRQTLGHMVYLEKLQRLLKYQSSDDTIFFLDQGPVFRLARLHMSDFAFRDQSFESWWTRMLNAWACTLDAIFWVDAQDEVLLERILTRSKWHEIKDLPKQQAREFLTSYRKAYQKVISGLTSDDGPEVLFFSTDHEPLEQITTRILNTLDPGHRE